MRYGRELTDHEQDDVDDRPFHREGEAVVFNKPRSEEDLAREKREHEQHKFARAQVKTNERLAWFTGALVLAAFCTMVIGIWQATISQKAANAAKFAAETAANTLAETSANDARQSVASHDALQTAIDQFRQEQRSAHDSLQASIDQFDQEQRAWIGIGDAAVTFSPADPWEYTVNAYNTGKTPSNHTIAKVGWMSLAKGTKLTEDCFKRFAYPPTEYQIGDIFPGSHLPLKAGNQSVLVAQAAAIEQMKRGDIVFYIFGEVDYQDVFKAQHWARYCYWVGRDLRTSSQCAIHNDSDSDYPRGKKPN